VDKFHREVESMQRKLPICLDDRSSPIAKELLKNFQKLEDEVQVGKSPATLNIRLKRIKSLLKKAVNNKVMSYSDGDNFEDWVDDCLLKYR